MHAPAPALGDFLISAPRLSAPAPQHCLKESKTAPYLSENALYPHIPQA